MAGTASADTLRDALVSSYNSNPTLTAQREALRATDATVAIARAAGRPQVSGTVGVNRDLSQSGILETGSHGPTLSAGLDISYPLFNGGAVKNNVRVPRLASMLGGQLCAPSKAMSSRRPSPPTWT